ncbi:MAG: hypothetical protein IKC71_03735 [Clostridia bacterium]|nr:hypothetical protein [Clostridia bacterium]
MTDNILNALTFYCQNEVRDFIHEPIFAKLKLAVKNAGYNLLCEYRKGKLKEDREDLYLIVSVLHDDGRLVELDDDKFLISVLKLVDVDSKRKVTFYSWKNDTFLDTVKEMIKNLNVLPDDEF